MQYTDIIEDIKQCDALLIGIGSEFSNFKEKDIEDNDIYISKTRTCMKMIHG